MVDPLALSPEIANRIMQAAASIEPADHREAAILGGIVGCLTTRGRFDLKYIQHHTHASLEWARQVEMHHLQELEELTAPCLTPNNVAVHGISPGLFGLGNIPDASLPSENEVRDTGRKFHQAYGGGSGAVTA